MKKDEQQIEYFIPSGKGANKRGENFGEGIGTLIGQGQRPSDSGSGQIDMCVSPITIQGATTTSLTMIALLGLDV